MSLVLFAGCKGKYEEIIIKEYENKIAYLETEKIYYCGELIEMLSDGMIEYMGENKFRLVMTKEVVEPMPMDEFKEVCQKDLGSYIKILDERLSTSEGTGN
jgi:hypothetical protein